MARKLPAKDVVIIGLGWTGSILAQELTDEGLDVVAIERGPWRDTATDYPRQLRAGRVALSHPPRAVPAAGRRRPSPSATNGSDGAADPHLGRLHAAERRRRRRRALERGDLALPAERLRAEDAPDRSATARISCPTDMTIQDWGVTYDELEPHYDQFEYLCGTSRHRRQSQRPDPGRAAIRSRGRARGPIPTRRRQQPFGHALLAKAARELGYKPFPQPSGNMSQAYTSIRSACGSGPAPIAASANGSAAAIIRRPARRPRSCRCWCASRISRRATSAR